jgi:tellurite resistance protein
MSAPAIAIDRNFATVLAETYDAPAVDETKGLLAEAALRVYVTNGRSPLQRRDAQCLTDNQTKFESVLHVVPPSYANETKTDGLPMSFDKNPRTFRERVRDAMRLRVGKGRALTVKQVATAIGCSDGTIENLMGSGTTEPSSRVLRELMMFFDDSFANEVWGCDGFVIVRVNTQKATVVRKLMEAHDELRRLG